MRQFHGRSAQSFYEVEILALKRHESGYYFRLNKLETNGWITAALSVRNMEQTKCENVILLRLDQKEKMSTYHAPFHQD